MDLLSGLGLVGLGWGMFSSAEASSDRKSVASAQAASVAETAAHNADVSRYDAAVTREDALRLETATGLQVHDFIEQAGALLGHQASSYGASGVAISGSAKRVIKKTRRDLAKREEIIRFNGLTAAKAKESLAKRYELLADYGLRDAASQAYQIELAGAAEASAIQSKGIGDALFGLYNIGSESGWFS